MAFGFFDANETPEQRRKRHAMAQLLAQRSQPQMQPQQAGMGSILNALMMRPGGTPMPQQQPFSTGTWAQGLY